MEITKRAAVNYINQQGGKIFTLKFKKRTTGEIRTMVCRQGVKKYLVEEPTKPGLDFKAHELIPVFDMAKQDYRSIPVEGITEIKINGVWYAVSTKEKV